MSTMRSTCGVGLYEVYMRSNEVYMRSNDVYNEVYMKSTMWST